MTNLNENFTLKANRSFKWTAFSEILSKLLVPVMNMILARLIAPSIFGIVATLGVITSFATMLSESGFARYTQQHQFSTLKEMENSHKTSMTCSTFFGLLLFVLIFTFKDNLSNLIGASGYEWYLVIASAAIPFHSIISIEVAILKRDFKFKETAFVRVASTVFTAIFEIALAFLGYGIVALTVGPLISSIILSFLLFLFLKNKKIFGFSFTSFKNSFKDNTLFIIESFLVWLSTSIDILLIGSAFGEDLTGIYKMGFNTQEGIIALITAVFSPVLITLFSRLDFNNEEDRKITLSYQEVVCFLGVPIGIGMFVFSKQLTFLFLGEEWFKAYIIFASFGLINAIKIPISNFISTTMISKGKPTGSIIPMIIYVLSIVLCCICANYFTFDLFVIVRACCILPLIIFYSLLCKKYTGLKVRFLFRNLIKPLIGSIVMFIICAPILFVDNDIKTIIVAVVFGATVYFLFMNIFFEEKFNNFINIVIKRNK